ncbi:drug/metabolite transporter (DMT)-like permease [Palleronia aestuarii]|uniref:Drug/metabolite transporter (DMT)-like permease n=1 Tax=Palleronia aestuarii TaxID=568105 RepID=A0A2W7P2B6_9RHOB|nr:DMT family transporter [Palleronia aestuarii]PZX17582.1 drug/metabolite transporter (DMT)-like permease [Palleronia aestuarii]
MKAGGSDPGRGIALMLSAVLCFTVLDATAKSIAEDAGLVMALWSRFLGQAVVVALIVAPRGTALLKTRYPKLQVLRSAFLLMATTFFFAGLVRIGLAEATAIFDVSPVLITLGAALFLGERFGVRRAAGVTVSLAGALVIIRPGTDVFTAGAFLPLCAAVCYSGYALATRFVGRDENAWTSLFYTALIGAAALCVIVPFHWQTPAPPTIVKMLAIGFFGAAAQFLLIRALQVAEASAIAPFSYTAIAFASLWGFLFFGEVPDGMTFLGMAIIAAAGLYVWHREVRSATPGPETRPEAQARGTYP